MPGFGDLVQKAVYLGVGLASYAGEKAGTKLAELQVEAQKLADELVKRGEMTTEEARRFVDDAIRQAQQPGAEVPPPPQSAEPRRIEILDDEEESGTDEDVDELRDRVKDLQEELRRLERD
ncbi:phasin family protein [Lyngbya sp. CCY1209]|uniref:phasin family protein n=1 Tax=Lyngbya sp. CCY1209 TaxID=2886103 RepID=UPI002D1FD06B|nr:phasin family protein [Lyngbya sp. CCY1209]MEB3887130.1 phasin family protein [Lyngbya sp. CCY1209]